MKRLGKAFDLKDVKYFKGFPQEILDFINSESFDNIQIEHDGFDNDDFYLPLLTSSDASSFWMALIKQDKEATIQFFIKLFMLTFKSGWGFFYDEALLRLVANIHKKSQQIQKQLNAVIKNLSTIALSPQLIDTTILDAKLDGEEYFTAEDFNKYISESKKMCVFIGVLEKSMGESLEFQITHELINHPISRKKNIPNQAEIYFTKVLFLHLKQHIPIRGMYRHIADVVNLLFHNKISDKNIKDEDAIKKLLNKTRDNYTEFRYKNKKIE